MFTNIFNCGKCNLPFDFNEGEPRRPGYYPPSHRAHCLTCYPTFTPIQRGLMDFLKQPAFKKTDKGYDITPPFVDPTCVGCDGGINIIEGHCAFLAKCGHYLCLGCDAKKGNLGVICKKCNLTGDGLNCYPDALLANFCLFKEVQDLKTEKQAKELNELNERLAAREKEIEALQLIEVQKEKDRRSVALKNCSDCGIEQPVERLFKCKDCDSINCGSCSFVSHREHAVVQLLCHELEQLEQKYEKKYTETLDGLHGNLKYIQTTIDEAVEKVMRAGKERLAELKACTKHGDAQKIVMKVDDTADKFEKHCEAYIPVARQLATRLTELGEDIMKNEE